MKNYKKPIVAWLGLAVLSMFSMTSTGADSFELQESILLSDLVATSSDAVMKTEEILEEVADEIEVNPLKTGWNNTANGFTYISATGEPLIETWVKMCIRDRQL